MAGVNKKKRLGELFLAKFYTMIETLLIQDKACLGMFTVAE